MTAGVKNGPGVLFTEEGHKSYEGEFLDNKFHGSDCKLFHPDGQVAFIGQISNGVKSGYGQEYFSNGVLCYQGNFGQDKKIAEGKGKIFNEDNFLIYEGGILDGIYQG